MATSASLHGLLSVAVRLLDRAIDEGMDLPQAIVNLPDELPPLPDIFYAQRVIRFVRLG